MFEKIKSYKDEALPEIDKAIREQAYKNVLNDLKDADIDPEEMSDDEFNQLMAEEIKSIESMGKGAMVGSGVFAFLELLG